jgi:hypothetical protein
MKKQYVKPNVYSNSTSDVRVDNIVPAAAAVATGAAFGAIIGTKLAKALFDDYSLELTSIPTLEPVIT